MLERFTGDSYSLTEKGLEYIADDKTPEEYIIRKLSENNGTYNFLKLSGKQFKNETEKFASIQRLESRGWIMKIHGAIGQTYMLTDKYDKDQVENFKKIALKKIKDTNGNETSWPSFALNIGVPKKYTEDIKNLLMHDDFIRITTRTKQGDFFKMTPKVAADFYESKVEKFQPSELHSNTIELIENMQIKQSEEKGYFKLKYEIFWPAVIGILPIIFFLGLYFGNNKFDREKIELYNDKTNAESQLNNLRDSIKKSSVERPSLHKVDSLKK
jgi:hypothetical protein